MARTTKAKKATRTKQANARTRTARQTTKAAKKASATKRTPKKAVPKKAAAKATKKTAATARGQAISIYRMVRVRSEKTGRDVLLRVTRAGTTVPTDVKRTGIKQVDSWTEIPASSRSEATAKFEAGEGKKVRRS